ncbi:MAG: class I SAM-dependent methyltransferase [Mariprofundaceae bacterium]|nr:class I SAM-dependent methyltransferase [Mariprofundaceae bacterium]
MKKEQRKRIVDRHRDSLTRFGYHPNALYWSSRGIQETRFSILAEIGIKSGDSVLDVGCGFGDFKEWFEKRYGRIDYAGVDLSPDLLAEAGKHHADVQFFEGDLFDMSFTGQSFDWVILSGTLNEQLNDDGAYAHRVIERMFELCRKGVAFNLLDIRYLKAHDLQSHQPEAVLRYCRSLSPDCRLRDDYLQNDFTIYIRRSLPEHE